MNYYNEFDPFAASWLRQLIADGLIPQGEVDERSIIEVEGSDLKGFTQCHFFAGIAGWSYALELAGWDATRPVWTGSPPCQPFSVAGKGKAQDDERHLWPHFFELIRECQPPTVFGEQVAAAIKTGWFDDLQTDMEAEGYATAMVVLPACSVNAPHKRERLFYVAHSLAHGRNQSMQPLQGETPERTRSDSLNSRSLGDTDTTGLQMHGESGSVYLQEQERSPQSGLSADSGVSDGGLAFTDKLGSVQQSDTGVLQEDRTQSDDQSVEGCSSSCLANTDSERHDRIDPLLHGDESRRVTEDSVQATGCSEDGSLGNTECDGLNGSEVRRSASQGEEEGGMQQCEGSSTAVIYCRDGKYRQIPTEPALFPVAYGIPNRVGLLRGAGNAIVPQVAAEIIKAYMEY